MKADAFWAALPLGPGVRLIAQDPAGIGALDKPAGILSHPNRPEETGRSLLQASYVLVGEYFQWPAAEPGGAPRRLWLLNRLDSATSGVVLVAAEAGIAAAIRAEFKKKQVRKIYLALVFGRPERTPEIWRDRLAVQKKGGVIRAAAGHIPAESRVSTVRTGARPQPALALLRLEPRTGRSHQLRVQCADRHLPIVGDQTYGDFRRNRDFAKHAGTKRLFLHSLETTFTYTAGGRARTFSARAPLPPEFETALA